MTRSSVEQLFTDFTRLKLVERDQLGTTLTGQAKHWHHYTVVAQKRF
ncbi:MAG: hypothetical protein HRU04_08085 [Oceanospirillaceae bacterium]|nr:hypothetical protein [Oceanospirillaceae bacterium]